MTLWPLATKESKHNCSVQLMRHPCHHDAIVGSVLVGISSLFLGMEVIV